MSFPKKLLLLPLFTLCFMTIGFSAGNGHGLIIGMNVAEAHTFDTTSHTSGSSNPQVLSYTVGNGGTLLVLGIVTAGNTARTGGAPTYNGVAMTQVETTKTSTENTAELWYISDPDTGVAHNISVPNGGGLTIYLNASSYIASAGKRTILDTSSSDTAASAANPSLSLSPLLRTRYNRH